MTSLASNELARTREDLAKARADREELERALNESLAELRALRDAPLRTTFAVVAWVSKGVNYYHPRGKRSLTASVDDAREFRFRSAAEKVAGQYMGGRVVRVVRGVCCG